MLRFIIISFVLVSCTRTMIVKKEIVERDESLYRSTKSYGSSNYIKHEFKDER